jgi:very-short-patch-repair endonuclease
MGASNDHSAGGSVWGLAEGQHGVVAGYQLLELGLSPKAIQHRVANGRLHRVGRGVFAVGRPELSRRGWWMAAALACGPRAVLSHGSAAALWGIGVERPGCIELSAPVIYRHRQPGIVTHRRKLPDSDLTVWDGIPVTRPSRTLVDLAARLSETALERAVNEADRLDLVDPETLRRALGAYRGQRGVGRLRMLLDRRTFQLTDSELERRFLRLVADVGLTKPLTRQHVNGFRVDFFWPDLGLVVETDGLRYHRTPAQQARDRLRDQAHTAAGFTPLRFTHAQVRFEAGYVSSTLSAVARRLEGRRAA